MFFTRNKAKLAALNEFDQVVEGNSLGKDAFRRLKKNKMAVIGMIIVAVYSITCTSAMFLPFTPMTRSSRPPSTCPLIYQECRRPDDGDQALKTSISRLVEWEPSRTPKNNQPK